MTAHYFIEILARNGDVIARQRCATLPVTIGRAYDNDFVLDDAHAAPHHAVLEADADGALQLRDLGSQNGIVLHGRREQTAALDGSTVVRLGHTRLRVRDAGFPVAPELTDTTMHAWEGGAPALAGMALVALFIGVEEALTDTASFQAIRYLLTIASGLAAGLAWSGIWALVNRLFGSHARMGRHLFILGAGLIAIGAWRVLSTVLAYAWSAEIFTRYGNLVVLLIVCGMVYFHVRTIRPHLRPRRMLAGCGVLLGLGTGLVLMSNLELKGHVADEPYMAVLLPPSLRASTDHSVDDFMGGAARLQERADADRQRGTDGNDDDEADDGEVK
ncbi:type III secretion system (T3SS) inner membrane Yop/YscD-like protein [Pseudoduganella lurida]|uniref:Type III secretion system (T3SS) inner membrane Yop/YscD-like protein n=1 Tax=Pseudoduganella lurida TaxID=1036180 RepID=A0A562RBU5_9BURK|nr:FHA domain-containing protein [Pseudoduganella lurida]TWI66532.1 type III secretion system (T3SS) inner membrane Yop/YscD-like protein [Pseudoduganella lurida]